MVKVCPTCGQGIFEHHMFHGRQQQIFNYIRRWPGNPTEELVRSVYADDPNGGPNFNTIAVHITHINKRLKPLGYRIKGQVGRGGGAYRLIKLADEK